MRQCNKTFAPQQESERVDEMNDAGEPVAQTGRCLCGNVKFTIRESDDEVGACHCDMCRRWSGGPLLVLDCGKAIEFEGEEHIVRYKSSDWAERGFCGTCGSNLFYFLTTGNQYFVSAGALDNQSGLKFATQVFIDEKPGYYDFANQTRMMTGAELFALYAPPDEGGS